MQFLLPGPFRECYLFQRQNAEIVLRFADSIQPVASHAGEVVQTTGDTGDLMYVLASGTAAATRDFTGPGDSGLLAGADGAEKAPKKRHSLKRQQSQVSKSKKRMSAKLNGLDATFTPPTKRPTRPSMRRGRVERTMERSDCFGELVALAVHSVYHATLTSTSPAGFFATSQIQIYRNLSEFGGVLYDLRHLNGAVQFATGWSRIGSDESRACEPTLERCGQLLKTEKQNYRSSRWQWRRRGPRWRTRARRCRRRRSCQPTPTTTWET